MTESTRPHLRAQKAEAAGKRVLLSMGSILLPAHARDTTPLVIHFHGEPWLAERAVRQRSSPAAVIAIQLGSGSGVYGKPFREAGRFAELLKEAQAAAPRTRFRPIYVTSFSAGYGAVREILKDPQNVKLIDGVILMDSLHTGYTTGSSPGPLEEDLLKPFVDFAKLAGAGRKHMLITHSEVYPGTFASTTETADFLLEQLKLKRTPVLRKGPVGMQQLGRTHVHGFEVDNFAGNSAPDHVDHYQAMGEWLRRVRFH